MKQVATLAALGLLAILPARGDAARAILPGGEIMPAPAWHGGGCRKSSPPGQCCHMDNKAGAVHCH